MLKYIFAFSGPYTQLLLMIVMVGTSTVDMFEYIWRFTMVRSIERDEKTCHEITVHKEASFLQPLWLSLFTMASRSKKC
jgi:hypothetical protein